MADDSDEETPKRLIENQPYDELLEVPDGEDVASIYTPTPRHPKNSQQRSNQQQQQVRPTPPSSSSGSSASFAQNKKSLALKDLKSNNKILEDERDQPASPQQQPRSRHNKMNDSSPSETPKPKSRNHEVTSMMSTNEHDLRMAQHLQNTLAVNNINDFDPNSQDQHHSRSQNNKNYRTPTSTPSFSNQNKQLVKTGYEEVSHPVGFKHNDNEPMNPNQQMGDSASEGNESDGDSQENFNELQGGYDPAAFRDLAVSTEIKDIFKFIERYQPQTIELEFKLKPFIPDYIPSIGDIDAFIKVPRPDGKQDTLGFNVVDEPSSNQSDPHVLDLFFRTLSKQTNESKQPSAVKSVESNNTKAIESWIRNISALQKNKPVQTVNYQRAMPNIDSLMQVWSPEFEELLKEVSLPSPELNVDLSTYVDIICALLDIPVYKSKIQSIHVLLTLFSEFKNSEHFKNPSHQSVNPYASASFKQSDGKRRAGSGKYGTDQLVID